MMTLYCPKCKAPNETEAGSCQVCEFDFTSPGGQNHSGLRLTKYITLDLPNITFVVLALLALVALFGGYFLWNDSMLPDDPWVLAIKQVDTKTELHALDWRSGNSLNLGQSEGDWEADIHLAISNPPMTEILETRHSGHWAGGNAILLPATEKTISALRQNDLWQVSLVDLKTGVKDILVESQNVAPFVSMAPAHGLTAVSIPATDEKMASLHVFSLTTRLDMRQSLGETSSAKAILSPDGQNLIYTVTMSRSNITQVRTETQVVTETQTVTNTQAMTGSRTTSAGQSKTYTQAVTHAQLIDDAQIVTETQIITATSQEIDEAKIITTTRITTDTQHFYQTTFYITNLKNKIESVFREFKHGRKDDFENYRYTFTPDGQSIIYQNGQRELYVGNLDGQYVTKIFGPAETVSAIKWQLTPGSDYVAVLLTKQDENSELVLVSLHTELVIPLEENFQAPPDFQLTFLDLEQILYSPTRDEQIIYNIAANEKVRFSPPAGTMRSLLLAKDRGLAAFVTKDDSKVIVDFFNPFYEIFTPFLNFDFSPDQETDHVVEGFDLTANYLVFRRGDALYLKNILSNRRPVLLTADHPTYLTTLLTPDLSAVLYTASSNRQFNIYRFSLKGRQSETLLENGQLLDTWEQTWLSANQS